MPRKVPTVTVSLVRAEMSDRGWIESTFPDEDAMHYHRGKQKLVITLARLCSSTFQMRNLSKELDLLDKGR